jgi:hypothetical protein
MKRHLLNIEQAITEAERLGMKYWGDEHGVMRHFTNFVTIFSAKYAPNTPGGFSFWFEKNSATWYLHCENVCGFGYTFPTYEQ